jgi:hypothetical protein
VTPAGTGVTGGGNKPKKVKPKLPSNNNVLSSDCGGTESDASVNKLAQRAPALIHYSKPIRYHNNILDADAEHQSQVMKKKEDTDPDQTTSFEKQMKHTAYYANQKPSTCKNHTVRGPEVE